MKIEHSISINSDPATVFAVYKDVPGWAQWDLEMESASLESDFAVGTQGKLKPKGSPESKILLTEVTENQSFTVECGLPLCKMHFIHQLTPSDSGTDVVNQLEFSGLLGPVFELLLGNSISKTIPTSLAGLKEFVENKS